VSEGTGKGEGSTERVVYHTGMAPVLYYDASDAKVHTYEQPTFRVLMCACALERGEHSCAAVLCCAVLCCERRVAVSVGEFGAAVGRASLRLHNDLILDPELLRGPSKACFRSNSCSLTLFKASPLPSSSSSSSCADSARVGCE
jgi:hypothetical protein